MIQRVVLCVAVCLSSMAGQSEHEHPISSRSAQPCKSSSFLVGKWSGEAQSVPRNGRIIETGLGEDAQYKLDGLLLEIEANRRNKVDNKVVVRLSVLSHTTTLQGAYRMRTFNDGRYLRRT